MYILKCNFRSPIHAIFTFAALPPPWDLLYLCLPQPLIEGLKSVYCKRKWDRKCTCEGSYCRQRVQYVCLSCIVATACVTKLCMTERKVISKNKNWKMKKWKKATTWTYSDLSYPLPPQLHYLHYTYAYQEVKCLSTSSLSCRRAAGQGIRTERGFPIQSAPLNTYKFRLKTRQTNKQTFTLSTHHTTTSSITKNTLPFFCIGSGTTNTQYTTANPRR